MAQHRWWEPYGGRSPDPLPTLFDSVRRLGSGTYAQPLYYGLGAAVLKIAPSTNVESSYWRLRIFSMAIALATLALAWAGSRLLFGPAVALGATAVAALNPQFLLTAISVNPDTLLALFGAVLWWLVARVLNGRGLAMSILLIPVTAGAALLTKRSAIPLAVVGAVITVGLLVRPAARQMSLRSVTWMGIVVVASAAILSTAWATFASPFGQLAGLWANGLNIRRPLDEKLFSTGIEYATLSIDYVWLVAGWIRFSAPEQWLWFARTLTVAGFAGAVVLTIRSPRLRRPLATAWLFVIVQVTIAIGWGFLTLSSPQGRYLFPVIAPATALLWLGLTHATPARFRPYAAPVLVAILAVMDVTGFTNVLIPAYLPWG